MRLRYRVIALVLAAACALTVRAQDSSVPYVYYYSPLVDAFVIERADGGDSRTLAQQVIPEAHNEIHRPTWSPSGEWLTWRSAVDGALGPSYYSGWIIRGDGTQRLSFLDHPADKVVQVSAMQWAPGADVLFVIETSADLDARGARVDISRRYLLIDASAQAVVASYRFDTPYFEVEGEIRYEWLDDAGGVVVQELRFSEAQGWAMKVVSLHPDGRIESDMAIDRELDQTTLLSERAQAGFFPSPDGRYAGLTSLRLVDLTTGSSWPISQHSAAVYATSMAWHYDWHAAGQWVITASDVTFAGCCGPSAFTVLRADAQAELQERRELTVFWGDSAGWLPERAVPHLAPGSAASVLAGPVATLRKIPTHSDPLDCNPLGCRSLRAGMESASGRYQAQPLDEFGLEVRDAQTGRVIAQFERVSNFVWVGDRLVMNLLREDNYGVVSYDPQSGETVPLPLLRGSGYTDRLYLRPLSPDSKAAAVVAVGSIFTPIHLWDVETGERLAVFNWYAYDVALSPDGRWLAAGNSDLVTVWDISSYLSAR